MGVSRIFQRGFKKVARVLQGNFRCVKKVVLKVFQPGSKFQGCFQSISNVFRRISKKDSVCLKEVTCCMTLIAASRAEGGLVQRISIIFFFFIIR